jgi:prepilin-type N-terminal cleavage/methylation domain-containing protein
MGTQTQPAAARARRRSAYTLIELIVVMAVIAFVAALTVGIWAGFGSSTATTANAEKIQEMLLIAKQKAIRDRLATGVRLIPQNPANPYGPVKELIYVQQPPPFTPPITQTANGYVFGKLDPGTNMTNLLFLNVNFTGGLGQQVDFPVQVGDYLEINGGGSLHQIRFITSATRLTIADPITVTTPGTTTWRIIRGPRPVQGEEPVELTGDIIIDLGTDPNNAAFQLSPNVPIRTVTAGTTTTVYREIMFAPSGSVVGQGTTSNDKIILWVRDSGRKTIYEGEPMLIAVQVRTGLIGGYAVDVSSGDPFSNTRDPHASGL